MIDDDFDKIVRNMFEQFFGRSLRIKPEDSGMHIEIDRSGMIFPNNANQTKEFVDTVEYDNQVMVIVETIDRIEDPEAHISDGLLRLRLNPQTTRTVNVELPAVVDLNGSEMSYSNGVIEIRLAKTDGVQKEGTLTATR